MKQRIIFITGATATGKSEVAVRLAKKIDAEIISCDSMQVYKGMDIITSKPPVALRKAIPHHLLGVISRDREYDVSKYYKDVSAKIREILRRGRVPLIVGGTGLYMSVLIDGIFKSGASSKSARSRLYKQAREKGSAYLFERLKSVDPEAASKIHPNDTKRIIRALEVFESTGKPISRLQKERKGLGRKYDIMIFGLNMPRDELYKRIDERVENMFEEGLAKEIRRLLKSKLSRTASYAIGIRELEGYFGGLYGLDEAKRLIKRNTRLYAKRQLTWFRKDKRINWIEVSAKQKPQSVANRIWKKLY